MEKSVLQNKLRDAIFDNDIQSIKQFIKEGADVNWFDKDGCSLLFLATCEGKIDIVKLLIKNGADVNIENKNLFKQKPIQAAISGQYKDIIELLLDSGVDANDFDKYGQSLLCRAIDKIEIVKLLIEKGADINIKNKCEHDTWPPVMIAVYHGHDDVAKFLIDKGADLNVHDEILDGQTLLHAACSKEIAEILINKGLDPSATTNKGLTPLHDYYKMSYHKDLFEFLVSKVKDVDMKGISPITPLQVMVSHGNIYCANILIEHGADVNAKDPEGFPLIDHSRDKEMAEFLVSKGAKVSDLISAIKIGDTKAAEDFIKKGEYNIKELDGHNALHYAVASSNLTIAKMLIEKGIDINDGGGQTPLHIACGNLEMVKLLVENGADINADFADESTDYGTPLSYVISANNDKDNKVLKYLISKGANVNVRCLGTLAVWTAARNGNLEAVRILLENGATLKDSKVYGTAISEALNSENDLATVESIIKLLVEYGEDVNMTMPDAPDTPIFSNLVFNNEVELAKLLIKLGAKVNSNTLSSKYYVLEATQKNYKDMLKLLLENNAEVNSTDNRNKTALDYAQTDEIKQLLISHGAKSGKELK